MNSSGEALPEGGVADPGDKKEEREERVFLYVIAGAT